MLPLICFFLQAATSPMGARALLLDAATSLTFVQYPSHQSITPHLPLDCGETMKAFSANWVKSGRACVRDPLVAYPIAAFFDVLAASNLTQVLSEDNTRSIVQFAIEVIFGAAPLHPIPVSHKLGTLFACQIWEVMIINWLESVEQYQSPFRVALAGSIAGSAQSFLLAFQRTLLTSLVRESSKLPKSETEEGAFLPSRCHLYSTLRGYLTLVCRSAYYILAASISALRPTVAVESGRLIASMNDNPHSNPYIFSTGPISESKLIGILEKSILSRVLPPLLVSLVPMASDPLCSLDSLPLIVHVVRSLDEVGSPR